MLNPGQSFVFVALINLTTAPKPPPCESPKMLFLSKGYYFHRQPHCPCGGHAIACRGQELLLKYPHATLPLPPLACHSHMHSGRGCVSFPEHLPHALCHLNTLASTLYFNLCKVGIAATASQRSKWRVRHMEKLSLASKKQG